MADFSRPLVTWGGAQSGRPFLILPPFLLFLGSWVSPFMKYSHPLPNRNAKEGTLIVIRGFPKIGDPQYRPQIEGFPSHKDPNKVPLISETLNPKP